MTETSLANTPSKYVTLRSLYDFIRNHRNDAEALRLKNTALDKEYCKRCDELTAPVEETRGFYLWGAYDKKGYWKNIYLDEAGYGNHSSLKERINKELKTERCGLWRWVRTEEDLLGIGSRIHPTMWPKYRAGWKRAMQKAGTTHIAWVPTPHLENTDVKKIEPDLIEALNPTANYQRPAPPESLQEETNRILGHFRRAVHAARQSRYRIDPA